MGRIGLMERQATELRRQVRSQMEFGNEGRQKAPPLGTAAATYGMMRLPSELC